MKSSGFKYDIGEKFSDQKRNIEIIDREYFEDKNGRLWKKYKYKCFKCGASDCWIYENHLLKGVGCSCCNGKTIIKGINDLETTNPELVKYFVNKNDPFISTAKSKKEYFMKCPECGKEKMYSTAQLSRFGFCCKYCSDGISYPEKYLSELLNQLNINYLTQLGKRQFDWCNNYRYDFYLKDLDVIIEVHGMQHYQEYGKRGNFKSYHQERINDINKEMLAFKNGIFGDKYIVLDCRCSDSNYIKNSILKSNLSRKFDLSCIDWNTCDERAISSNVKIVCDYKNNNPDSTTTDISKVFDINRSTILKYLKRGSIIGICEYHPLHDKNIGYIKAKNTKLSKTQI
jgi:hypothetical protein